MLRLYYAYATFIIVASFATFLGASPPQKPPTTVEKPTPSVFLSPSPTPKPKTSPIPDRKVLENDYHIFQTFNNCGPASLSMALSYYGVQKSQQELGQQLRPYQNPQGDNDDKSVTLEELSDHAQKLGFTSYHRPNGNIEIIKRFISNGMPVLTRTWTKPGEDIGHFRVIKGYDENQGVIIQDDSLQGKNLNYAYGEFDELWKSFNYEYLVLVPKEKDDIAKEILGKEIDTKLAWENAAEISKRAVAENPSDIYARFNLSVAYYQLGKFQESVNEFEKVETLLPFRTLWYQIEPIQAYFKLGQYGRVFEITDKVLEKGNRAFSELYMIRGQIYQKQGQPDLARQEFEKAVFYNNNFQTLVPDNF